MGFDPASMQLDRMLLDSRSDLSIEDDGRRNLLTQLLSCILLWRYITAAPGGLIAIKSERAGGQAARRGVARRKLIVLAN